MRQESSFTATVLTSLFLACLLSTSLTNASGITIQEDLGVDLEGVEVLQLEDLLPDPTVEELNFESDKSIELNYSGHLAIENAVINITAANITINNNSELTLNLGNLTCTVPTCEIRINSGQGGIILSGNFVTNDGSVIIDLGESGTLETTEDAPSLSTESSSCDDESSDSDEGSATFSMSAFSGIPYTGEELTTSTSLTVTGNCASINEGAVFYNASLDNIVTNPYSDKDNSESQEEGNEGGSSAMSWIMLLSLLGFFERTRFRI